MVSLLFGFTVRLLESDINFTATNRNSGISDILSDTSIAIYFETWFSDDLKRRLKSGFYPYCRKTAILFRTRSPSPTDVPVRKTPVRILRRVFVWRG